MGREEAGALSLREVVAELICIAITPEAFAAVEATLPLGAVGVEPMANKKGEREIRLDEGRSTSYAPCAVTKAPVCRRVHRWMAMAKIAAIVNMAMSSAIKARS